QLMPVCELIYRRPKSKTLKITSAQAGGLSMSSAMSVFDRKTGLPYASHDKTIWQGRETFVTHSCGHDIHMASWVGTAKTLARLKDGWRGTLIFIAQPAEEEAGGARAMLADGLCTRFPKPDAGFALHDGPFPYGYVSYTVGVGSSNADALYIKFKGRGG